MGADSCKLGWNRRGLGKEEEEGARFGEEEGEGVRKSYGGYGGEGAGAWHLPVPRDSYCAGRGQRGG